MEIIQETLDSSETRLSLASSKLKTILLVCLIISTSLLVRQTLQIQHSCNPMIHWSGELPLECKVAIETNFQTFDDFSSKLQSELNTSEQLQIERQGDREASLKHSNQPLISQKAIKSQPEVAINSPKATEPETTQDNSQSQLEKQFNSAEQFVNEHSNDIVGGIAGVAGGVASVAAASATAAFSIPVAGAVAIGLGIWFLIRSTF